MYLQSQSNNQYSKVQIIQSSSSLLSLPTAPPLQFQQQPKKIEINKDSAEHKIEHNDLFDNTKENIEERIENARIITSLSLNSDKIIDNYRHTIELSRDLLFEPLKLQKDYINAFQARWIKQMKTNVDNYLSFQEKMIALYNQMCNSYLKTSMK